MRYKKTISFKDFPLTSGIMIYKMRDHATSKDTFDA